MKNKDVEVGGVYMAKIGDRLVRVEVVRETVVCGRSAFVIRREDTGRVLPKPRTGAALRELFDAKVEIVRILERLYRRGLNYRRSLRASAKGFGR